MPTYHRRQLAALRQALDEARFGPGRTLNLRATLPTVAEAEQRAEQWLRAKQVEGAGEVLVITGRGNASPGGVSVVREAVLKLLRALRRRGVVAEHTEHTAGSFVVRLAPVRALLESPRRRRDARREAAPAPVTPPTLAALDEETRALLRRLATVSLEALGVHPTPEFVESEMLAQFARLAPALAPLPAGSEPAERLRAAVRRALDEYDERW